MARFSASKYASRPGKGCLSCGAAFSEGDPIVYDGDAKTAARCPRCPNLTPQEAREIESVRLRTAAAAEETAENARRLATAPSDIAEMAKRCGNLGPCLPLIGAHSGILTALAHHRIALDTLLSALVYLAAADTTRANCSQDSWMSAAINCATWGLIPTAAADTPVYLFCRDRGAGKLVCERTRWGYATQIQRTLPDAELQSGWAFHAEAVLGDLAARKDYAAADKLRASLERRAATLTPEEVDGLDALGWYLQTPAGRFTDRAARAAVAQLGKLIRERGETATSEAQAILPILRTAMATPHPTAADLTADDRAALDAYRLHLEEQTSSLSAADEALLAGLRLPNWSDLAWYRAVGDADQRLITWGPPSLALWSRPPMNPRRVDGVPSAWWARLRFTDTDASGRRFLQEFGFELDREAVYTRAVKGGSVKLTSAGLLTESSDKQSPWMDWHGEMGEVKAIREMLKDHPTLLARLAELGVDLGVIEEEAAGESTAAPTIGSQHLRAVRRQIAEMAPAQDFAAEAARLSQREMVGRDPGQEG